MIESLAFAADEKALISNDFFIDVKVFVEVLFNDLRQYSFTFIYEHDGRIPDRGATTCRLCEKNPIDKTWSFQVSIVQNFN